MAARVELLCIGTELLSGRVNTHVAYVARRLAEKGLRLAREASLPDDPAEIAEAVKAALSRADAVLVLGGLGPTFDDLTREAVGLALSRDLVLSPVLLRDIERRFKRRGLPMAPANKRQAYLVEGATAIPNANGSAPGQWLKIEAGGNSKILALLPGPLFELKPMFEGTVLPIIRPPGGGKALAAFSLHLSGALESEIDHRIRPIIARHPTVTFTILAGGGVVDLFASAEGSASGTLSRLRGTLRSRLARWIFAENEAPMEAVIGDLLRRRGETLALAESLTGGLVGHRVTGIAGSSDYFKGGVVAYANDAKTALLDVEPETLRRDGAVSEACAGEMAEGARRRLGADWGLALTGIAGPSGGSKAKPVGQTWLAVAGPRGTTAEKRTFPGDRATIKARAAQEALAMLWRTLKSP